MAGEIDLRTSSTIPPVPVPPSRSQDNRMQEVLNVLQPQAPSHPLTSHTASPPPLGAQKATQAAKGVLHSTEEEPTELLDKTECISKAVQKANQYEEQLLRNAVKGRDLSSSKTVKAFYHQLKTAARLGHRPSLMRLYRGFQARLFPEEHLKERPIVIARLKQAAKEDPNCRALLAEKSPGQRSAIYTRLKQRAFLEEDATQKTALMEETADQCLLLATALTRGKAAKKNTQIIIQDLWHLSSELCCATRHRELKEKLAMLAIQGIGDLQVTDHQETINTSPLLKNSQIIRDPNAKKESRDAAFEAIKARACRTGSSIEDRRELGVAFAVNLLRQLETKKREGIPQLEERLNAIRFFLSPAAYAGDIEAQRLLGEVLAHTQYGYTAEKWLKRAADSGSTREKLALAHFYLTTPFQLFTFSNNRKAARKILESLTSESLEAKYLLLVGAPKKNIPAPSGYPLKKKLSQLKELYHTLPEEDPRRAQVALAIVKATPIKEPLSDEAAMAAGSLYAQVHTMEKTAAFEHAKARWQWFATEGRAAPNPLKTAKDLASFKDRSSSQDPTGQGRLGLLFQVEHALGFFSQFTSDKEVREAPADDFTSPAGFVKQLRQLRYRIKEAHKEDPRVRLAAALAKPHRSLTTQRELLVWLYHTSPYTGADPWTEEEKTQLYRAIAATFPGTSGSEEEAAAQGKFFLDLHAPYSVNSPQTFLKAFLNACPLAKIPHLGLPQDPHAPFPPQTIPPDFPLLAATATTPEAKQALLARLDRIVWLAKQLPSNGPRAGTAQVDDSLNALRGWITTPPNILRALQTMKKGVQEERWLVPRQKFDLLQNMHEKSENKALHLAALLKEPLWTSAEKHVLLAKLHSNLEAVEDPANKIAYLDLLLATPWYDKETGLTMRSQLAELLKQMSAEQLIDFPTIVARVDRMVNTAATSQERAELFKTAFTLVDTLTKVDVNMGIGLLDEFLKQPARPSNEKAQLKAKKVAILQDLDINQLPTVLSQLQPFSEQLLATLDYSFLNSATRQQVIAKLIALGDRLADPTEKIVYFTGLLKEPKLSKEEKKAVYAAKLAILLTGYTEAQKASLEEVQAFAQQLVQELTSSFLTKEQRKQVVDKLLALQKNVDSPDNQVVYLDVISKNPALQKREKQAFIEAEWTLFLEKDSEGISHEKLKDLPALDGRLRLILFKHADPNRPLFVALILQDPELKKKVNKAGLERVSQGDS